MSWTNDELMAHALVGDLSPDQAAAWEARCAADPQLRAEFEGLLPMVSEVERLPTVDFDAGFVDRTMARIAMETSAEANPSSDGPAPNDAEGTRVLRFDAALRRQFRWVAPAAAAAAVILLALNVGLFQDPDQSAWEAAVGLDPITIESVYAIGEEFQ